MVKSSIACLLVCWTLSTSVLAAPGPSRQQELLHLLRHDCGSCHGLTLKGGLGPALTPAALRDRAPDVLVRTILDGRPQTAMPPWRAQLSRAEAQWLVQQLLSGATHVQE